MQALQDRLRLAFESTKRTQEDVADRAKAKGYRLTANEISKIIGGKTPRPGPTKIAGLAVGLGVSADFLLGLDGNPEPRWAAPPSWDGRTERRRGDRRRDIRAA